MVTGIWAEMKLFLVMVLKVGIKRPQPLPRPRQRPWGQDSGAGGHGGHGKEAHGSPAFPWPKTHGGGQPGALGGQGT